MDGQTSSTRWYFSLQHIEVLEYSLDNTLEHRLVNHPFISQLIIDQMIRLSMLSRNIGLRGGDIPLKILDDRAQSLL
jgi:hypothetical protein